MQHEGKFTAISQQRAKSINMSFKIFLTILLCEIYYSSAIPAPIPQKFTIGDDSFNWADVLKARREINESIARSGGSAPKDDSVFNLIVGINAKERGNGAVGRSDANVFLFQGDIEMKKSDAVSLVQGTSRHRRAVMNNRRKLWPKNIPYVLDNSVYYVGRQIRRAIAEWESTLPCMGKWQDVTRTRRPRNLMYFFRGSGCYSQVGMVGGSQRVSIGNGCQQHGVVVHEIGHAMGLWHEQSRPDRDRYVSIQWQNIIPAMRFNFQKHSSGINSFGVTYDYDSVMHYGAYAFSSNRQPTIRRLRGTGGLGQRQGLSYKDKQQVKLLYGCTKTKPTAKPSGCTRDIESARNCIHWKKAGYCTKQFVVYMKTNCCKTCTGSVQVCNKVDADYRCPGWKGYCSSSSYMKSYCRKTCEC